MIFCFGEHLLFLDQCCKSLEGQLDGPVFQMADMETHHMPGQDSLGYSSFKQSTPPQQTGVCVDHYPLSSDSHPVVGVLAKSA